MAGSYAERLLGTGPSAPTKPPADLTSEKLRTLIEAAKARGDTATADRLTNALQSYQEGSSPVRFSIPQGGQAAPAPGPAPQPELQPIVQAPSSDKTPSYSERLLQSPSVLTASPEITPLSSYEHGASTADIAVASLADDPQARARFYASHRGLPLDRYRIANGRVVYQDQDGQWYFERPNAVLNDPRTWFQSLAGGVGPAIPAVAGTAAGIAALPFGLVPSIPAAAAGGAAGQGAREVLANRFVGQEPTVGEVASRMAQQGALEGLGQGIGVGMTAFANRAVAPDIAKLDRPASENLMTRAGARGIQLTPAEATGLPTLKAEQKALGNLPSSSDVMGDFYERRAGQVSQAVTDELNRMAPETGVETAGQLARAGARGAMADVAANRAAQAGPLYQQAFAEGAAVDTTSVLKYIKNVRAMFPKDGQVSGALARVNRLLTNEVQLPNGTARVAETNLEKLHNAKLEIDQMLEATGDNALGRTTKAKLTDIKTRLLAEMDAASPTYGNARALFADLSPGVQRVREGILGVIADLPDTKLQTAATRLFSAPGIRQDEVRAARTMLEKQDPAVWQRIKRAWLEEQWTKAGQETLAGGGPPANQGAKFRKALIGDPRQRTNLDAMLSPAERASFKDLLDVLQASGSVKPIGSDTAWNQEAMKLLRQKNEPWLSRAMSYLSPKAIREKLIDNSIFANSEKMARLITSPDAMQRMREIKQLPTSGIVKRLLLGHLLTRAGEVGAESAVSAVAPSGVETIQGQQQ